MKRGLATLGPLLILLTALNSFSQQKLDREEILNEYKRSRAIPALDSVFRWDIHLQTRAFLNQLLEARVDTLVIYLVSHPGHGYVAMRDSCSTIYPVSSYFFWKRGGTGHTQIK
jgi:hypothetical protein